MKALLRYNSILILVIFIFLNILRAEEINQNQNTQLDLLINLALKTNNQIQALGNKTESLKYKADQSKKLDFPVISYSYYIDEVETRVGSQKQAYNIMQSFPFFGKLRTRFHISNSLYKAYESQYYALIDTVVFNIKDTYYEYIYLMKSIDTTREHIKLLESFENLINIKYKTNKAGYQDALRVQIELDKIKNKLRALESYRVPIISRLITLAGSEKIENIIKETDAKYPDVLPDIPNKEKITKQIFKTNPILKEQSFYVKEAENKVKLSKLNYFPDYALGVTYIDTEKRDLDMVDNGKDPFILMVKLKLPIWFKKLNAEMKKSKYDLLAKEEKYKHIEYKLKEQLEYIYYKIEDGHRKIELYRDSLVPKAEASLKTIHTKYKAGSMDFLNLIEAERLLLDLKLEYFQSIKIYCQQLAELEKIIGKQLEEKI
ncbi:TolC family protein [bacterium]